MGVVEFATVETGIQVPGFNLDGSLRDSPTSRVPATSDPNRAAPISSNTTLNADKDNNTSASIKTAGVNGQVDSNVTVGEYALSNAPLRYPVPLEATEDASPEKDLYRFGGVGERFGDGPSAGDGEAQESRRINYPARTIIERRGFRPEDAVENIAAIRLYSVNELVKTPQNRSVRKLLLPPFTKFFLQGVNRVRQERMQVMETFSSSWIFFFGEQTPVFTFSGLLLKSANHNWMNDFLDQYERAFRGTRAVERDATIQINVLDNIIEGYIFNLNLRQDSINHLGIPFSFNMVILKEHISSFSDESLEQEIEAEEQAQIAAINNFNGNTVNLDASVTSHTQQGLKLIGKPVEAFADPNTLSSLGIGPA